MPEPSWKFITSRPVYFLAFGLGTGLSPKAPGTVGTLVGYPLYFALAAFLPLPGILAALAVLYWLGNGICNEAGKAVGVTDHSGIVWDEIVAMALVLCFTPQYWGWYVAAFVAFRFFDIVKPWPIGVIDRTMKNGAGVMLDDLAAAVYATGVILFGAAVV